MPSTKTKKKVITIHGINTDGKWQENIRHILEPFFSLGEGSTFRYTQYRRLGFLKQIVGHSWILLIIIVELICAISSYFFFDYKWPFWSILAVFVITLITGFIAAYFLRINLLKELAQNYDQNLLTGKPHVIAHSFGTYLIGHLLWKYPATRVDRIVLTGAVLPRKFPWEKFSRRFNEIRNEVGKRDLVVILAGLFGWIPRGFGFSGFLGFKPSPRFVHNCTDPIDPCKHCNNEEQRVIAPIHNIQTRFEHSTHFHSKNHILTFWLPFLWGISPGEFRQFLDHCQDGVNSENEEDGEENEKIFLDAKQKEWTWWGEATLYEQIELGICNQIEKQGLENQYKQLLYARDPLTNYEDSIELTVDNTVRCVWQIITIACAILQKETNNANADITNTRYQQVQSLYPHFAAQRAIETAISELKEQCNSLQLKS